MKNVRAKKKGYGLAIKTFQGRKGSYIVFRTPGKRGTYHAFIETEAKAAAIDCGSQLPPTHHTSSHWDDLWEGLP